MFIVFQLTTQIPRITVFLNTSHIPGLKQYAQTDTVNHTMAGSGELWVQCFTCCLNQQEPRNRRQRPQHKLRIDRSMIGMPMNFRHTAHISSGDLDLTSSQLSSLQAQMQRKGGYDTPIGVKAY